MSETERTHATAEAVETVGADEELLALYDRATDFDTALSESGPVFIMEDAKDAMAILQAGGNAAAVGMTGGDSLIRDYDGPMPDRVFIVAGGTTFGEDAALLFKRAFKDHGKDAPILHIPAPYDSLQDLLDKDAGLLRRLIHGNASAWVEWNRMQATAGLIDQFLKEAKTDRYQPIETGFSAFDRVTGGGLVRQTLVMLAAAPGQGKTTLTAQLFERMAANGHEVLFINLEMSREQLIAKSLARYAYNNGYGDFAAADIMRGYKWTEDEETAIKQAALAYKRDIALNFKYADRDETTAQLDSILTYITKEAERAISTGKQAPLVVLDYLHIVQTQDGRGREEEQAQAIKRTVTELKAFAIRYKTVVFVILATGREANKGKELSLYSGRDTSNIEYSADMFLTLQDDEEPGAKNKPMKMRIEKNRMGEAGISAKFYFDAKHGIFTEAAPDWLPDRVQGVLTF